MIGHRVTDAIGQESCAKLAEDGWQIVVVVRPVQRNIRAALDQRVELLLRLGGVDGMDRSENVDGHVIRRERIEPSEIDAAVYRSDVDHFPGVDSRHGGKKPDMRGIVEMVGARVAASAVPDRG